ncbi:MAG: sigma-70 family RNA polymerase sigma factor, partial [bacterium]
MTRNRWDAEDLVQDVCGRAYRFFHRFKSGTNPKAWLLTVLRNIYINDFRKKAKRPPMVSLSKTEPLEDSSMEEKFSALSPFGSGEALERLSNDTVKTAIDELADELKMVVILFYVEEFSYKEIANIVGCPKGTVMSRL